MRATLLRAALALGLSFALWAFVSFSQNPEELVRFEDVSPQVVGLASDLVIVDANGLPNPTLPAIDITLRTDRVQRTELRPVDIRAVIDLDGLGAGEHLVPVNVQATRSTISFSVPRDGVQPSAVQIRIEQVITHSVPINLQVSGNLPFSFERGDPQILLDGNPIEQIEVSGPQNRVERVAAAQTTANIEQLRASYLAPLALTAVDETGQPVEGVRLSPGTVTVRIPITSVVGLKLVPVEATIEGLPASGYTVSGVQVDPPLISLTGSSGPLDAVAVLRTEPISIAGATQNLVRRAALVFPGGTSPQVGEPVSVRVTVQITPLDRTFQVALPAQVNLIGLSSGLLASANPNIVSVAVTGSSSALDVLSGTTLRADIDVSGLGPGSYQLPVQVTLPDGIRLVGDPPEVTIILRLPTTPTSTNTTAPPSESESATPEPTTTSGPSPTPAVTTTSEPAVSPTP